MLSIRSALALPTIVAAARQHPAALQTLSLAERLQLACRDATPVAQLGLELVQAHTANAVDGDALAQLASARCGSIAAQATAWVLGVLGDDAHYTLARVMPFFDAALPATRAAAFAWLAAHARARADAGLWSRLLESPFDDVRIHLVRELDARDRLIAHLRRGLQESRSRSEVAALVLESVIDAARERPLSAEHLRLCESTLASLRSR